MAPIFDLKLYIRVNIGTILQEFSSFMKNYKKILFIVLLFCVSNSAFSQQFSIDQLRKFNEMDLAAFKKEIKEVHKYSYYDKTQTDEFHLFEYDSPDYVNKISKFDYLKDKSSNMVEFSTTDEKLFNSYKKNILSLGYKETGTGKIPGGEVYKDYAKKELRLRLVFPKEDTQPPKSYTVIVVK